MVLTQIFLKIKAFGTALDLPANVVQMLLRRTGFYVLIDRTLPKFMFSEKATKIEKIFSVNLTVRCNRQIDGEGFINFCGLLKNYEL